MSGAGIGGARAGSAGLAAPQGWAFDERRSPGEGRSGPGLPTVSAVVPNQQDTKASATQRTRRRVTVMVKL